METRKTRQPTANSRADGQSPTPKKRFNIQKLEERIAPKRKGGGGQLSSGLGYSASVTGPY